MTGNENHRYNLRPRKAKTVSLTSIRVNITELVSDKLKQKAILKQRNYNHKENFEITNFQLSELLHYKSTCLTEDCEECAFFNTVKKFAFQMNSLLGYQKGYANLSDTKIQKQGKKIKFEQTTKREVHKAVMMKITLNCIHLANYYCISMREVAHLNL